MTKWTIYDYIDPKDGNLIRAWTLGLQRKERAKLNQRLDALAMHGPELIPGILSPTGVPSVFKLKIRGQVQLRPMLCEGPGQDEKAFTLLMGAIEMSWDYVPKDAPKTAARLRDLLVKDLTRRGPHERVS